MKNRNMDHLSNHGSFCFFLPLEISVCFGCILKAIPSEKTHLALRSDDFLVDLGDDLFFSPFFRMKFGEV